MKTTLRFPFIRDCIFRYRFSFHPVNLQETLHRPNVIQQIGYERRPLSHSEDSTIVFYTPFEEKTEMEISLWLDPSVKQLDFALKIDWIGSLSMLSVKFRTMMMTLVFACTVRAYSMPKTLPQHLIHFWIASIPTSLLFHLVGRENLLIGKHDWIHCWLFPIFCAVAIGLTEALHILLEFMRKCIQYVVKRRLLVLHSSRLILVFTAICMLGLFFVPAHVALLAFLPYSFLLTVNGYGREETVQ
jgi:hypothetical protein